MKSIKTFLEKIFKHELSVWIHRLNIVAVILSFIHVQLISYITAIHPFIYMFDIASIFVLGCYLFSKFIQPLTYEQGILLSNRTIAQNVQELIVKLPRSSRIELLAGDYVFLAFPDYPGLKEMHPFSIANAPSKNREIELAIRGDGDFTKALTKVTPKSRVNVDGGYGRYQTFLNDQPQDSNIVILAGGIGVTPLLSTIEANEKRNIEIFYTAHHRSDLLYLDRFKNWQQRSNFRSYIQVGRFQDNQVLNELPKDWEHNTVFLIGGPSSMMHHWVKFLKQHGAGNGQIYFEEFSW